jgi:hypothetical protein
MITKAIENSPALVGRECIQMVFSRYQTELEWLAYFVTGDKRVAAACVADACTLSPSHNDFFDEWLLTWARHATMRIAVQAVAARLHQFSAIYEQQTTAECECLPVVCVDIALIKEESRSFIGRLDVLSRCALIICGVYERSFPETAFLLGVGKSSLEKAYCVALKAVEVIRLERLSETSQFAAVCN